MIRFPIFSPFFSGFNRCNHTSGKLWVPAFEDGTLNIGKSKYHVICARTKNLIYLIFYFGTLIDSHAFAQTLDNLQVLSNLTGHLIQQQLIPWIPEGEKNIVIKNLGAKNKSGWLLESQLTDSLKAKKNIFLYNDELKGKEPGNYLLIEFKSLNLKVRYHSVKELPEKFSRKISVAFFARVIQMPEGRVLWNDQINGDATDEIKRKDVVSVENRNIPFTSGQIIEQPQKKSIIQPVLVAGVSGVVIYLFYSLRSR